MTGVSLTRRPFIRPCIFRRVGDAIEWRATVYDPEVLAEPWSLEPQMMWVTNIEIEEPARCEDRDVPHIVDGSHHDTPR